jgi:hypothetical protein
MKVSWRKKSRWERALEPITSRVKGRELTINGSKALTAGKVTKPAARVLGGLVIATVVSAVVSAVRGQDGG